MNLRPLGDRVIVRPKSADDVLPSGLVLPDTAKEKPQEGEVLAVGPGNPDESGNPIPVGVDAGDTVIYSKYGGTEITVDGEELLILTGRDLLAVVEAGRKKK
jgi:chaperonin GroES